MKISVEVILTAEPGDMIDNFVPDALNHMAQYEIRRCLLSFNSWYYYVNTYKFETTAAEIIEDYTRYCNKGGTA